jgi:hypothetical protein
LKREKEEEEEEEREEGEKHEEAEEEEESLYPSLLRRDIANNDRQDNLVKSGKRGNREKREQGKVVAVAGAVSAETRYEVETNAEREITILASNDHMVLRREEEEERGKRGGRGEEVFYRICCECQRGVEEGAQDEVEEERAALTEGVRKKRRQ